MSVLGNTNKRGCLHMEAHQENRKRIVHVLQEELVGPSPQGEKLDCSNEVRFESASEAYRPYRQKDTGEEILQRDSPIVRYGVGVLYPKKEMPTDEDPPNTEAYEESTFLPEEDPLSEQAKKDIEEIRRREDKREDMVRPGENTESDPDEFDLSSAYAAKPSSMAISFLAEFPEGSQLCVEASGGRYRERIIHIGQEERRWWLRSPVSLKATFLAQEMCGDTLKHVAPVSRPTATNLDGLVIRVAVFSRPLKNETNRRQLVTVCLANDAPSSSSRPDEQCLFQSHFRVMLVAPDGGKHILPYPSARARRGGKEERTIELLYRKMETYAIGHGCAANWGPVGEERAVGWVSAECLPWIEVPNITPDAVRKDGTRVEVSMKALAGLDPGDDGMNALLKMMDSYEQWIDDKRGHVVSLDEQYRDAAEEHLRQCAECARRMRQGFEYLQTNTKARRAFQLANHAILLQQIRARREPRTARNNTRTQRLEFSEQYLSNDILETPPGLGMWRAFQIAFLLLAIRSAAEGSAPDRQTVELIWFPTGGGKTEAYLGLAAFSIFMRRLNDPSDAGVSVLMRYTLRLLTAQQFIRAAGLTCAMEYLRRQNSIELGETPFSIGIWLGGGTTPNNRTNARKALHDLRRGKRYAQNKFVLDRCPWCGAQIGPGKYGKTSRGEELRVIGYVEAENTVIFECPDQQCEFSRGLPVYVIDDDVYDHRPSLIIGTVDKFAQLAWRPQARSLFGIGESGVRAQSPPGLIIQDELHLISGPLGSMVGLYETVIEELCTDRRGGQSVPPKIVCSTATIRRYAEQIRALYGRDQSALFPPPALDAEDSFFARYERSAPGKVYVGVHAPGLRSTQTTEVRTMAALLQAPVPFSPEERDPWWTLVTFFNSLRELGTTLTLLQSGIPSYLEAIRTRQGIGYSDVRTLHNIKELTGRIRSDKVPEAISLLEVSCTSDLPKHPLDVCLTSSIMEVGVDIDRLSLIVVVGQPKTTAQYIQVTGRIGRNWRERPGLVVTLYNPFKPRDCSHFEQFRNYHERLYAQVEPTSVTPFSAAALDRALHAVIAAYIRQMGNKEIADSPYPYPEQLIANLQDLLLSRVRRIGPDEARNFERVFRRRTKELRQWQRTRWDGALREDDAPQLIPAGTYIPPRVKGLTWPTPQSMRNVDAECQAEITGLYLKEGGEADDA